MAQQIIDLTGSAVDSVRAAFKKINENFTEVFTACGPAGTGTYANTVSQTASLIDLGDSVTAVGGDSVRAAFVKIIANFDALYAVLPGTQQTINLGSGPNTQTGDTVVSAFDKINTNFTNLYTTLGLTPTTPESEDPAYTSFTPKVYDLSRDTVDTSSTVDDANTFADPYTTGLQLIDLGAGPDTQTGDSVYVAFTKVNHNFVELYDVFGPNGNTNIQGNTITANNFVTPASGTVRTGDITAYGNVETTGNVIASGFFYPNGVAISGSGTGSYGNANVADYLASNSNVTITTTANITGRYFFGNGSQLVGLPATYSNANVASYLPIYSGNLNSINNITMTGNLSVGGNITYQNVETGNLEVANAIIVSGNVTASYFIGNGSNLTNLTGANVVGNVTSAISATYVTGLTGTNVNVALGYVPLNSNATALTAQYVTGNSQPNITSVGNLSSLTVTGNVSANYFIGNGRNLTGIDATSIQNGTSNVKVYANSNVTITSNGSQQWSFNTNGSTVFPGGTIIDSLTYSGAVLQAPTGKTIEIASHGFNSGFQASDTDAIIYTDAGNWIFGSDGNLTSPGNITVNGNVTANNFFGNITQLYNNGYTATLNDSGQLSSYFIQASSGYFTSPYGIAFTYAGDTNQQFSWTIVNADALALKSTISSTLDTTLLTFDRTTGNLSLIGNVYTSGNVTGNYFIGNFAGNVTGNISAAGANTQVLFNDAGSVNATSGFTFNKTTSLVTVGGNLTISGNGSILLPRGTDSQRPNPATTGMFRFSNTSSKVEWYTGSTWQAPITDFTLTTANAQSGDGSTTVFPLPVANASTAGTIISINGIVQRPISAYSITSGNVTFTEAPSATDVVDFRIFTTTSSISTVADMYQTTGMFLDQTSGDQVIHLKTAGVDSLRIEANTKVDISGNLGVGGSFTALTKSFLIDHPSKPGYKLQYASLEGPEHGVYIRGRIEGRNVFELPDYWADLVDPGTISVHITPIGTQQNLYVEDIKNNTVYVAGSVDPYYTKFFYVVYGERKDVDKLSVEYN